jgi:predicted metalloendopeptidase
LQNTKTRAIFKADHVRKFLGYPQWLTDSRAVEDYYAGLKFTNYFFNNMLRLLKWMSEKDLRNVGQPVDYSWSSSGDSPAAADAFYDDELNAISKLFPEVPS